MLIRHVEKNGKDYVEYDENGITRKNKFYNYYYEEIFNPLTNKKETVKYEDNVQFWRSWDNDYSVK